MQTSTALEKLSTVRTLLNDIAAAPEVLALVNSGQYRPTLRLGDCIEVCDDLTYALTRLASDLPIRPIYLATLEAMQEVL